MIEGLKRIDEDVIAALLFMACRHALLLFVAVAGLAGFGLWAQAINEHSLIVAVKAAFVFLAVSWTISLAILLARRLASDEGDEVRSCLAVERAQQGVPESGPRLCRKHGVYWGNGVVSECAHRDGEGCVFPRQA